MVYRASQDTMAGWRHVTVTVISRRLRIKVAKTLDVNVPGKAPAASRATSPALGPHGPQATMTHDSTPYRVLKISELTRLIASQLVLISRKSTLSLACVCRYLEEPVLSTLWETQFLLPTLLRVLPKETWEFQDSELGDRMVRSLKS